MDFDKTSLIMMVPFGTLIRFREKNTAAWITISYYDGLIIVPGLEINKIYEVQALYNSHWTPESPYEYTLGPQNFQGYSSQIQGTELIFNRSGTD